MGKKRYTEAEVREKIAEVCDKIHTEAEITEAKEAIKAKANSPVSHKEFEAIVSYFIDRIAQLQTSIRILEIRN